jgi:hypothetical protein
VNAPDPSWPETLRGLPAEMFLRWKKSCVRLASPCTLGRRTSLTEFRARSSFVSHATDRHTPYQLDDLGTLAADGTLHEWFNNMFESANLKHHVEKQRTAAKNQSSERRCSAPSTT